MKILIDLNELVGKTIKKAISIDCDESIAITFDDNTYTIITAKTFGHDCYELELERSIGDNMKREIGIMSEEEYEAIQDKNREKTEKKTEKELKNMS